MHIQFFCPHWGSEALDFDGFATRVKAAGYDGVEMSLPYDSKEKENIQAVLREHGLGLIAQHWETIDNSFKAHKLNFERRLVNLAGVQPMFINSQTGKDYYSFEQNAELIGLADHVSRETGIRILHETHRGKFSFAAHIMREYLERLPQLNITLDASHWCAVAETFLEDQAEAMELAISRTRHIHARVGYTEGPQVPDPRDGRWELAFERHLSWWSAVADLRWRAGDERLTITPEFGAPPYMVLLPFEDRPIASQWEVNGYMMSRLRDYFAGKAEGQRAGDLLRIV